MIKVRSTIVLGAGCSHELKFPLGGPFKESIRAGLKAARPQHLTNYMLQALGSDKRFSEAINRLHAALAFDPSIDSALRGMQDDQDVAVVGRAFIAATILNAEKNSSLASAILNGGLPQVADTGLFRMIAALLQGVKPAEMEERLSQYTFVIFNYDRCFEQMLYMALTTWKHVEPHAAAALIDGLRIWHPYGRLPPLPWEVHRTELAFRFGDDLSGQLLDAAVSTIRTIDDGEVATQPVHIAPKLQQSWLWIFLGCGPHPLNFELLRPVPSCAAVRAFATSVGVPAEGRRIADQINRWTFLPERSSPTLTIEPKSAGLFVQEHAPDWAAF